MDFIEADFERELAEIEAESVGWAPLKDGVQLHVSYANSTEVLVVGLVRADMQAANLLWIY